MLKYFYYKYSEWPSLLFLSQKSLVWILDGAAYVVRVSGFLRFSRCCLWFSSLKELQYFFVVEFLPHILFQSVVMVGEKNYTWFGVLLEIVVGVFIVVFRHEAISTHLRTTETESTRRRFTQEINLFRGNKKASKNN